MSRAAQVELCEAKSNMITVLSKILHLKAQFNLSLIGIESLRTVFEMSKFRHAIGITSWSSSVLLSGPNCTESKLHMRLEKHTVHLWHLFAKSKHRPHCVFRRPVDGTQKNGRLMYLRLLVCKKSMTRQWYTRVTTLSHKGYLEGSNFQLTGRRKPDMSDLSLRSFACRKHWSKL